MYLGVPSKRVVTPLWISRVAAALDDKGHGSRKQLARSVGCTGATITQLLSGAYDVSEYVEPISATLGIALPPIDVEERVALLLGSASELDDADLEVVIAMVEHLRGAGNGGD